MPAAMSLASIGLFDFSLPPSATSLQDPEVLLPPKWTGHPCATALAVANRARVRPRLGCFATSCRVRISGFRLSFCGTASSTLLSCRSASRPLRCLPSFFLPCTVARRLRAWPRLSPRAPTPRTWRRRLSRPRYRVRRRRYPRPGLVQNSPSFMRVNPEGSTSLVTATVTVNASPRVSGSPGLPYRICELSDADALP
jgi:hypothetical protein